MSVRLDHGEDTLSEVHEINVTPFIDVMLVLLIIFMVAAPLATVDIEVDLPAASAEPQQRPDKPLYLSVKPDLTLAIGDNHRPRRLSTALARQPTATRTGYLFSCRQDRSLWRSHGGNEPPAQCGPPQGCASRT